MFFFDPILGEKVRKYAGGALAVANVLLVVVQVAADQLQSLPAWPWVAGVSAVLSSAVFYLSKFTTFGNRMLPPAE
jgi:hypothetical protein